MGGKANVYNLGELGVDTTTSPIHAPDGSLLKAQNAIYDPKGGEGGLRKRDGMSKVNASAAGGGGAIKGLISVPLPNPTTATKTLWASLGTADANTWSSSTDAATWTDNATLADSLQPSNMANPTLFEDRLSAPRAITFYNKLYYAGNQHTGGTGSPTIRCYDGTTDQVVLTIPNSPRTGNVARAVMDLCAHNGAIAIAIYDTPAGTEYRGRVLLFNPFLGTLEQVGEAMGDAGDGDIEGGLPYTLLSYQGLLWFSSYAVVGTHVSKIYRIRTGVDPTWTLDYTTVAGAYPVGMAAYGGKLYAAETSAAASAPLVQVRATTGAYTTSDTGSTTTGGLSFYTAPIVFEDNLYVAYSDMGSTPKVTLIRKFNGSAWSTALDISATYSDQRIGGSFIFKGNLYFLVCGTGAGISGADGYVLKLASGVGGAWTRPANNINFRGMIAQVSVVS